MNAQEFYDNANDTTKAYRLEAFSFTYDLGLNIYFDDMDDLRDIVADTEIEFWCIEEQSTNTEIQVKEWKQLETVIEMLENGIDAEEIETLQAIVDEGYAPTFEQAQEFKDDNYFGEFTSELDLGYELIDLNHFELPEMLQGYFDYEAYARDALISDLVNINGHLYWNR